MANMTQQQIRDALGKLEAAGQGTSDYARELYCKIAELEAAAFRKLLSPLTDAYRRKPAGYRRKGTA